MFQETVSDPEIEAGHDSFGYRDQTTGRDYLESAIASFLEEIDRIKDAAPPDSWIVDIPNKKSQIRVQVGCDRVKSRSVSPAEAAQFRSACLRRDRKQKLTKIVDELVEILERL
jgi:hypothetical protein